MSEEREPAIEYEKKDVDPRGVLRVGVVVAAVTVVAAVASIGLFRMLAAREARQDPPPPPLYRSEPGRLPPEPRLQSAPFQDVARLRAEEERALATYGWVDEKAGVVRIPIEEAMRIVAERASRGEMPSATGAPPASPAASPSPRREAKP